MKRQLLRFHYRPNLFFATLNPPRAPFAMDSLHGLLYNTNRTSYVNETCLLNADDQIGPLISRACHRGFDFTLLFEQSVLSIVPSALFLLVYPFRIRALRSPHRKTIPNYAWAWKIVRAPYHRPRNRKTDISSSLRQAFMLHFKPLFLYCGRLKAGYLLFKLERPFQQLFSRCLPRSQYVIYHSENMSALYAHQSSSLSTRSFLCFSIPFRRER